MKASTVMRMATVLVAAGQLCACGGGGGGGGSGGGGGGGGSAVTFSARVTAIELTNSQRNEQVVASGLPAGGATVTRN